MKRLQSPTLLSYVLIGFIVVALPLVASIVTAIARVDRLAHESHDTIMAVQQNAVASRGLVERAPPWSAPRANTKLSKTPHSRSSMTSIMTVLELCSTAGRQAGNRACRPPWPGPGYQSSV